MFRATAPPSSAGVHRCDEHRPPSASLGSQLAEFLGESAEGEDRTAQSSRRMVGGCKAIAGGPLAIEPPVFSAQIIPAESITSMRRRGWSCVSSDELDGYRGRGTPRARLKGWLKDPST